MMSVSREGSDSQSGHKTMSTSVRKLQESLNMHLDVHQKTKFVNVLNQFHVSRDVETFVKNLQIILDTPAKKQIFSLIRKVIPKSDMADYDQYIRSDARKFDTMPAKRSKKILQRSRSPLSMPLSVKTFPSLKKKQLKDPPVKKKDKDTESKSRESRTSDSSRSTQGAISMKSGKLPKSALKDKANEVKHIQIKQSNDPEQGFGFSIRGGSEFGIGIYVSKIDKDGMADKQGLVPGDLLMEINDVSFDKISHNEAAKIIRGARKLDMRVCRVGRIPGSFVVHQMYRWVDPRGRPVPPPPELEQIGQLDTVGRKSGFMLLKGTDERKVNVTVKEGQSLGLMIRGGREFGLGIYISGVDSFSMADRAGLKVGDQILDVNSNSYLDITHAEAVRLLKTASHLIFTIKDVGKLPYARTKIDQTSWLNNNPAYRRRTRTNSQNSDSTLTQANSTRSAFTKGIGSQLMLKNSAAISNKWDSIENQATQLLNETEQGTLRYYLSEYQRGFITVDGLAMASFELLNTKAKMTMMLEIRNWVKGRDLDKFDLLLQRREARQKQGFLPESYNSFSLDGETDRSHGVHILKTSVSAPASRVATMRDRTGRVRKHVSEIEMEPLRMAIEQIEDDPDFIGDDLPLDDWESLHESRLRSTSLQQLNSPNLHKTSLSSFGRSYSVETLTPVYIDTTSHLPHQPITSRSHDQSRSHDVSHDGSQASHRHRHASDASQRLRSRSDSNTFTRQRSNSASSRPRSKSASQRHITGSSYAHRQRSGSNNSTLRRKHKSVDDLRPVSHRRPKTTPFPSRRNSDDDIRASLSTQSYTHLHQADPEYPDSPLSLRQPMSPRQPRSQRSSPRLQRSNVVYADVHHEPRPQDGPPSDDSGVELNGHHGNDNNNDRIFNGNFSMRQKRVTISLDNPVDIDDVLERRSSIISTHDHNRSNHSSLTNQSSVSHSNHSTLTNQSNFSHSNHSTLTNSRQANSQRSSIFGSSLSPHRQPSSLTRPPVEIRLNDGEGSIDTMSIENPSSPRFMNHNNSFVHQSYSALRKSNQSGTGYDSDDEPETFDIHSEMGDNSDLYVSPLDRVLDDENISYSDVESRQIEEARQRYGNIPLMIIPVYKTKPTLGMAIEGGANTRQPLPRVINLQPGGSAYESGGLKVGHVILEVNQRCLVGMEHIAAAKTIAEAFKNKSCDNMELLVTESKVDVTSIVGSHSNTHK